MDEGVMDVTPLAPLLVVTGTGTDIGKTTLARALVGAWATRVGAVAGIKPIESGGAGLDGVALGRTSTFHVTRSSIPYLLTAPVSPHRAARLEGTEISLDRVVAWTTSVRRQAHAVVLELSGGLYTPLTTRATNADLTLLLSPTKVLLLAPDRIGVLHDVLSTVRAARADRVTIDGIVLSSPLTPDPSTSTNAAELDRVLPSIPILDVLPRDADAALVDRALRILRLLDL